MLHSANFLICLNTGFWGNNWLWWTAWVSLNLENCLPLVLIDRCITTQVLVLSSKNINLWASNDVRSVQTSRVKRSGLARFSRVRKTQRIRKISILMRFMQRIAQVWTSHYLGPAMPHCQINWVIFLYLLSVFFAFHNRNSLPLGLMHAFILFQ